MTIQTILDIYEKFGETDLESVLEDETAEKMLKELNSACDLATKTVLEKIDEKRMVMLMLMIQKVTASVAAVKGSQNIILAELSGELQTYTHTVIMATIGMLIGDEIL